DGLSNSEVAWRLRRSPGFVERVEALSGIERTAGTVSDATADDAAPGVELRAIERCVMNSLEAGSGYAEIASRLRRTPNYVRRVERFAKLRLASSSP
ncbi:MAG: hypothetical protein AAGK32_07480, partial [Actinomycetota bacterium]